MTLNYSVLMQPMYTHVYMDGHKPANAEWYKEVNMFECPICKSTCTIHKYADTNDPYIRRTCAECGHVYPAVLDDDMVE